MLYKNTVKPETFDLLKRLMQLTALDKFALVGSIRWQQVKDKIKKATDEFINRKL
jgi:hypothetical protein